MSYLLDTNACIALMEERQPFREKLAEVRAEGDTVFISVIVHYELLYGVFKSTRSAINRVRLRTFLEAIDGVLQFTAEDAEVAGEIRAELEQIAQPIGPYDVLIAGQALHRNLTLVTANAREFSRVPNLRWEDWAS